MRTVNRILGPERRSPGGLLAWVPLLCLLPGTASAHEDTGGHWTLDPWVVAPLVLSGCLYALGTARLWGRAGVGRGIRLRQAACYTAGWVSLAGALVSPLHWLGEHLFTAHMVEHEVVMACAAPLLAFSRPVGAFLWALPPAIRTRLGRASRSPWFRTPWRAATSPLPATVVHGAVVWLWHAPPLFEEAVTSVAMHRLQHLSFLLSALAFWWALARRADLGAASVHLLVTMIHTTLLGVLLALSPRVLFGRQTVEAAHWGLTPLEDQQLAGLVMWVPAGTIYAGAAMAFAALWVHRSGSRWRHGHALHPR
jgi:putative membrane protein